MNYDLILENITWLWSIFSIIGALLIATLNRKGYIIWVVGNCGWIFTSYTIGLWAQIPVWVMFNVICVYGWYNWKVQPDISPEVLKFAEKAAKARQKCIDQGFDPNALEIQFIYSKLPHTSAGVALESSEEGTVEVLHSGKTEVK